MVLAEMIDETPASEEARIVTWNNWVQGAIRSFWLDIDVEPF